MRCQFCNERCVFQKKRDQQDFEGFTWKCTRHPIEVIQNVSRRRYSIRGHYNIQGEVRLWRSTTLIWKDGSRTFKAHFFRNQEEEPARFVVEASSLRPMSSEQRAWEDFRNWTTVMTLKGHPKELTPENITTKIKTYLVFS